MSRSFYIGQDGRRKGPYSEAELKMLSLSERDLIWTEGMRDWQSVGEFANNNPSLFQGSAAPPPLPSRTAPPSLPRSNDAMDSGMGGDPIRVEVSKKPNPKPRIVARRTESFVRRELKFLLALGFFVGMAAFLAYEVHFRELMESSETRPQAVRQLKDLAGGLFFFTVVGRVLVGFVKWLSKEN